MHLNQINLTMQNIFLLLVLSIMVSCNSISTSENRSNCSLDTSLNIIRNNKIIPIKYKSYFKIDSKTSFEFEYDDIERLELIKIDSLQLIDLLPDDELLDYNSASYSHYFYTYQSYSRKYQAVTIIVSLEYKFDIFYLIYSETGQLLSKFSVASSGGDGLFANESYGRFINDTTYLRTSVFKEFYKDDDPIHYKADSLVEKIIFNSKGKLINSIPSQRSLRE